MGVEIVAKGVRAANGFAAGRMWLRRARGLYQWAAKP